MLPLFLGCLACDVEFEQALMKGSLARGLDVCVPFVARLFGLRCGGGARFDER